MPTTFESRSCVQGADQLGTLERKAYKFDFTEELKDADGNLIATISQVEWVVNPSDDTLVLTKAGVEALEARLK